MKNSLVLAAAMAATLLTLASQTSAQKTAAKLLTAEGYRDLIVNTSDAMSGFTAFGEISPGTRVGYDAKGRQRDCIMTFKVTPATTKSVADQTKAWTRVRVPRALAASHAAILRWMRTTAAKAKLVPQCFEPLLNAGEAQWDFMVAAGEYDEHREKARKALARLGVTLPPIVKPKTDSK